MKLIAAICFSLLTACQTPVGSPIKQPSDSVITAGAASGAPATTTSGAPGTSSSGTPDSTALGGPWFLQAVLPSDTAAGKMPALILDLKKARFSGNTGCNTMRGEFWFSSNDSSLSFSDRIVTTKMACQGYNEPAFLKSLKSTSHYSLHNGVLTLLSDDKTELSHWTRKPAPPSKTLKA